MNTVVVSPHLDDAAISASTQLGKGGATVVTVFTGLPPTQWPTTWWDKLTGATSSRERQLERRAEEIWLPAAIGGHRDHFFARDAALRAAARVGHEQVVLYADYPYVISYGWPADPTGVDRDPFLDTDFWLNDQLTAAGLDPCTLSSTVVKLGPRDLAAHPEKLDFELFWRMKASAASVEGH
jgi:hypothetical protein